MLGSLPSLLLCSNLNRYITRKSPQNEGAVYNDRDRFGIKLVNVLQQRSFLDIQHNHDHNGTTFVIWKSKSIKYYRFISEFAKAIYESVMFMVFVQLAYKLT